MNEILWKKLSNNSRQRIKDFIKTNNDLVKLKKFNEIIKIYSEDVNEEIQEKIEDNEKEEKLEKMYLLAYKYMFYGISKDSIGDANGGCKFLNKAINTFRKLNDKSNEGSCFSQLSLCYTHLDDNEKAIDCCKTSISLSKDIGDSKSQVQRIQNLSGLYSRVGDNENALKNMNEVLNFLENDEKSKEIKISVLKKKSGILFKMNNFEEAAKIANNAVELIGDNVYSTDKFQLFQLMGNVYTKMNKNEEASEYFNKYSEFQKRSIQNQKKTNSSINFLPSIKIDENEKKKNQKESRERIKSIVEKFPGMKENYDNFSDIIRNNKIQLNQEILNEIKKEGLLNEDLQKDEKITQENLNIEEKSNEKNDIKMKLLKILTLCQKFKRPKESFEYYYDLIMKNEEKLKELLFQKIEKNNSNLEENESINEINDTLSNLCLNLILLYIGKKQHWKAFEINELSKNNILLYSIMKKQDIIGEFSKKNIFKFFNEDIISLFRKDPFKYSLKVSDSSKKTILNYYRVDDNSFMAWIIQPSNQGLYKLITNFDIDLRSCLKEIYEIESRDYKKFINEKNEKEKEKKMNIAKETDIKLLLKNLSQIYDFLISPIIKYFPKKEDDEIQIVLSDALLFKIPWNCLYNKIEKKYLIQSNSISIIPSIRIIEFFERKKIFNTNFKKNFFQMNYVIQHFNGIGKEEFDFRNKESNKILEIFSKSNKDNTFKLISNSKESLESKTKDDFNKIFEEKTDSQKKIIHINCNTDFSTKISNSNENGTIFFGTDKNNDSNLISTDIFKYNFFEQDLLFFPTSKIGDLSDNDEICENGTIKMIKNFFISGVISIILTLWNSKNNENNSKLIEQFYENLLNKNENILSSLRKSILDIFLTNSKEDDFEKSVLFWGKYLNYGIENFISK